jgi:hypothetical protein
MRLVLAVKGRTAATLRFVILQAERERRSSACDCAFAGGGLNRSAVGKTAIVFPSRRPQQLTPSTGVRSLLVPYRRAVLFSGTGASGSSLGPRLHFAVVRHILQSTPFAHLFNLLLKQTPCLSRLRPPALYPQGRRGLG